MMDRETFFKLFQAAHVADRADYARHLAADWLSEWPGDAEAARALARLEIEQKLFGTAIERLTALTIRDPEDQEAYRLLQRALHGSGDSALAEVYSACAAALAGRQPPQREAPAWTSPLARAQAALSDGKAKQALGEAQEALLADANLPLPAWLATRALLELEEDEAAQGQARAILDRWPESTAFRLLLADLLIRRGETDRGVDYLHRCVSGDPTGELAARLLGEEHPYRQAWPEELTASQSRPVPAEIQHVLGGTKLGGAVVSKDGEAEAEADAVEPARLDAGKSDTDPSRNGNRPSPSHRTDRNRCPARPLTDPIRAIARAQTSPTRFRKCVPNFNGWRSGSISSARLTMGPKSAHPPTSSSAAAHG